MTEKPPKLSDDTILPDQPEGFALPEVPDISQGLSEEAVVGADTSSVYGFMPTSEREYSDAMKQIFAPYRSNERAEASSGDDEYDHLFAEDYDTVEHPIQAAARNEQAGRGVANERTERYSLDKVLSRFDNGDLSHSKVSRIIAKYLPNGERIQSKIAMATIRANPDIRLELAEEFLDRQSYMIKLPERIIKDSNKSPNVTGYDEIGQFSSREYVALLALAKLDGTYDAETESYDQIKVDGKIALPGQEIKYGQNVEYGQHRAASDMVLYYKPTQQ